MKKRVFILLGCFFIITGVSNAQVKKAYAYKQANIPGTVIGSDDGDIKEKNALKKEPSQNFNYWFYLSIPKSEKITVTGIWINGNQYKAISESITHLPVKKIVFSGVEKNDTLIMAPATTNKVILTYPGERTTGDSKYASGLARSNELVIRYTWKGKTQYTTVKKIKELPPDVRV